MVKLLNNFAAPFWTKVHRRELFSFRVFKERVMANTRLFWKYVIHRTGRVPKKPPVQKLPVSTRAVIKEKSLAPFKQSVSFPRQVFANLFPRVRLDTPAAEWRRRAAIHLASFTAGRSRGRLPLLAFVGLALAESPNNRIDKDKRDLFEKIRELHSSKCKENRLEAVHLDLNLSQFEFGELLDQGCHAAVYKAKYVDSTDEDKNSTETNSLADGHFNLAVKMMFNYDTETNSLADGHFNLAVKMMFNYDTESNSDAILRVMEKEGVPYLLHQELEELVTGHRVKKKQNGSAHPNIVAMYDVFEDQMPDLPDNLQNYPAALPARINPGGFGRNSTMFLVMKRYDCTLSAFLSKETPHMASRHLMFTQLLEGIAFLQDHGIAHRDLKTDNILLDLSFGKEYPQLIITDFGCCVFREEGLQIPYNTAEISKGGNAALMAPEIACAHVGRTSVLDYSKSDLWTAGALSYEIFGVNNPFYRSEVNPHRLDSRTYRTVDLPSLPDDVPSVVQSLVENLLCRNSSQRVRPAVAATVMQLSLWMPRQWFEFYSSISLPMVQEWLVTFSAQLFRQIFGGTGNKEVPNTVKQIFLSRISYADFQDAYNFIHGRSTNFNMSHL